MMRAAIFDAEAREVRIEELPIPRPASDELLIKVCRCGLCGSDVSLTGDGPFAFATGRFGHEYAGEVIEAGRDAGSFRAGDRVAVLPVVPCNACDYCRWGNPLLCRNPASATQGLGEYAVVPAKVAVHLPESLSFADGALIEPIACGLHAMRLAGVRAGKRVLVIGGGAIALSAIYWARRLGAGRVVALSRSAHRADMIMEMGGDTILGFDEDSQGRIADALGGAPDIVAECVGKPGMIDLALGHVRPRGTVLAMGMCVAPEPIVPARATFKEARLIFPLGYTMDEFVETARAFDADRLNPERMVGEVIALDQVPATLQAMRKGGSGAKIHVDPSRSFSHA